MPWERVLRETPSPYPGAVAWSHENLIAVGQERSVCILVRPTSLLHFCLLGFSDPPSKSPSYFLAQFWRPLASMQLDTCV